MPWPWRAGRWRWPPEQSRHWTIEGFLELGDRAAADHEMALHAAVAAEIRQPLYRWMAKQFEAMVAMREGRFADADRLGEAALRIGRDAEPANAESTYGGFLLFLRWLEGRLEGLVAAMATMNEADEPAYREQYRAAYAFVCSEAGRATEARRSFDQLAADRFRALRLGRMGDLSTAMVLVETCWNLRDRERADLLRDLLEPVAGLNVVLGHGIACLGALARSIALLDTLCGDFAQAERRFADALQRNEALQSPPLATRTRLDWAQMLLARGTAEDGERARCLLERTNEDARALGMESVARRAQALLEGVAAPARECRWQEGDASSPIRGLFRRQGDVWAIAFRSAAFQLTHCKGLQHLQTLLRSPGRHFHSIDLVASEATKRKERARGKSSNLMAVRELDADPILDSTARASYYRRVRELHEEQEEAAARNDLDLAASLQAEIDTILVELANASGLNGRYRSLPSPAERARLNVSRAIKSAINKIDSHSPALGRHLRLAVKTGMYCVYNPDLRSEIEWQL